MVGKKEYNIDDKILIRPITPADTPLIVKWRNNNRVRMNFLFREPFTTRMHETWMKDKVETGEVEQFIIEELPDKTPVGCVYLRDVNYEAHTAEYGIFLGEDDACGKGYGKLAANWAVAFSREELQLEKLILRVLADNEAAVRSYKSAGFVQTEYIPEYMTDEFGKRDLILMERML